MQFQELLMERKQRGYEIAKKGKVVMQGKNWLVPSQSSTKGAYKVELMLDKSTCTCPDFQKRGIKCKHIFAVEITISVDSSTIIIETKRITYSQNWIAYDKAKTQEKELFMKLLNDLVQNIQEEPKNIGRGRPKMVMSDMVFASALKVYTTFSLRRFTTDMKESKELGYIQSVPHYSCVALYMESDKLTPILQDLITLSAMPLKAVETKFAIDSTGFRTTKFTQYCKEKHNTGRDHEWIKAHICTGVKTNIITGIEITEGTAADSSQFIPLSQRTYENGFKIEEMSADKAYSSRDNYGYIDQIGGIAYIPYRSNATGKPRGKSHVWRKMFNYFTYNREEFLQHYHLRSNVESTNNMIKSKFTDIVRSKNKVAQINEVLLKVALLNE